MYIIGFSGKKQSGKDTAAIFGAEICGEQGYNCVILGFADELKLEVAAMLHITVPQIEVNKELFRPMLQWYGNEYVKTFKSQDYWINKVKAKLHGIETFTTNPKTIVFIKDVRFPSEVEALREVRANIYRVLRPGLASTDTHASETALDKYINFDGVLDNKGLLIDLKLDVKEMLRKEGIIE